MRSCVHHYTFSNKSGESDQQPSSTATTAAATDTVPADKLTGGGAGNQIEGRVQVTNKRFGSHLCIQQS